jgi:hypothetical protein
MIKEQYTIPIITSAGLNPIFIRANSVLLSQNANNFAPFDNLENEKRLEVLWKTEFDAQLVKTNSTTWTDIVFSNDSVKTMFLLKYST